MGFIISLKEAPCKGKLLEYCSKSPWEMLWRWCLACVTESGITDVLALTNLFVLTLLFPKGETEAWIANALPGAASWGKEELCCGSGLRFSAAPFHLTAPRLGAGVGWNPSLPHSSPSEGATLSEGQKLLCDRALKAGQVWWPCLESQSMRVGDKRLRSSSYPQLYNKF